MSLSGKVSIVTGASQGIGQAIALDLAAAGAAVHLVDIQREKLEDVAGRVRTAGGKATVHSTDVTQAGQVEAVVQAVLAEDKRIDHLVNNAGITRDNLLMRMKEEEWDAVLNINLKGVFLFSKAVIRTMIGQRYGRIVNIASVVGMMGNAGQANYAASKAGVIGFSKSLAREVASRGITVNCLAPGYIGQEGVSGAYPHETVRHGRGGGPDRSLPAVGRRGLCHRTGAGRQRRDAHVNPNI
jgi:3-oxoacyl-[acyl-carrier protein] reductase